MKKISNKIIIIAFLPTLIVGLAVGLMIYITTGSSSQSSIYAYEKTMRKDFDTIARWETETVLGILNTLNNRYKQGEMTLEAAKELGAEIVRNTKYGSNGYFWIDDYTGKNIVSSDKDNEGKNRIETQDVDGVYIIKDFILKAKEGGGFSDYRFPKKIGGAPKPKRSYSAAFEPFGWVIGTGNYIDDIDSAVAEMKDKQVFYLRIMLTVIILLIIGAGFFIVYSGKKIAEPIVTISEKASQIAKGDLSVRIEETGDDEIGELSKSMKEMVKVLRTMIEQITKEAANISNSGKIAKQTALEISESAKKLAGSTELATRSINEMSRSINNNSYYAEETDLISVNVLRNVRIGLTAVKKAASVLQAITEKITFINEVTSQTDILALNAGVEAASVGGKYGKGFSVIAGRIKELSATSAVTASKIDSLTTTGIEISEKSVIMLERLVEEVEKTAEHVSKINLAGSEQNQVVSNITQELDQLNILSIRNVATANRTEDNSVEIAGQSEKLLELISFFRLPEKNSELFD